MEEGKEYKYYIRDKYPYYKMCDLIRCGGLSHHDVTIYKLSEVFVFHFKPIKKENLEKKNIDDNKND